MTEKDLSEKMGEDLDRIHSLADEALVDLMKEEYDGVKDTLEEINDISDLWRDP